ncbi:MAG TPA: hypothetical protein PK395_13035 [bacterium]|nr:hypothetical protein [bacterium]HQP98014.1 hypothetical protein [bacterium]
MPNCVIFIHFWVAIALLVLASFVFFRTDLYRRFARKSRRIRITAISLFFFVLTVSLVIALPFAAGGAFCYAERIVYCAAMRTGMTRDTIQDIFPGRLELACRTPDKTRVELDHYRLRFNRVYVSYDENGLVEDWEWEFD